MAKLASLLVDLQLGVASLKTGVDQAKSTLKSLESEVHKIHSGFKAFNALATVGFAKEFIGEIVHATEKVIEFVEHGAELQDQMGKMAQAAGISTESFSRLSYAARLSDVANEDLGVAMNKLNKHMAEAASGSASASATFRALGINVKDSSGHLKSTDEVFGEIAGKFHGFADGANKSALALDIFGKAGTRLLPLLNEGQEGLSNLGDEAERFGVAISGEDAKKAQEFEDNLKRLKEVADGLAISLANEVTPALTEMIKTITAPAAVETIKDVAKALGSLALGTGKNLLRGIPVVGTVMLGADLAKGGMALAGGGEGHMTGGFGTPVIVGDKKSAPGLPNLTAINERKSAIESLEKLLRNLKADTDAIGGGPMEKLMARLHTGDLSEELRKAGAGANEMARQILSAANALLDAQVAAERIKLEFGEMRQMNAFGAQQGIRRQEFSQIGLTPMSQTLMKTQGFASFDAALQAMASETQKKMHYETEARLREMQGDFGAQKSMLLLADAAGLAADKASKAADGWAEYTKAMTTAEEDLRRHNDELGKSVGGMIQKGLETMFNALGHGRNPAAASAIAGTVGSAIGGTPVGNVIDAGMQGGAAGGPWGAVIGAALAILLQSKQFKHIMDLANQMLQMVADAFGRVFEGIIPVVGAINLLVGVLLDALKPVFDVLASVLKTLAPFIVLAAKILKALTPVLTTFSMAISFIQPLFSFLAEKVMPPLFDALKFVSGIILTIVHTIMDIWNGIIDAIDSVFNSIADIEIFKVKPFAFLKDLLGGLKMPTEDLQKAQDDLTKTTWQSATAAADAAGNLGALAKDAGKFSEELTNMPQGFKYQLRHYESIQADSGANVGKNDVGGPNGSGTQVTVNAAGSILTTQDLIKMIRQAMQDAAYVQTGSPFGLGGGT